VTGDTSSLLSEAQLAKSSKETAKKPAVAIPGSATANANETELAGAKPVAAGFDRNSVVIGEGISQSSLQSFASKLPTREGLETPIQETNSDLLPVGASGSAEASALPREKDNERSPSRVRPEAQGNPEPGAATARIGNPSTAGDLQPPTNSRSAPSVSEQLAREILARAELTQKDGRTDFRIRLEPPELGTVRIHLVAVDQTVSARVIASDEAARQAIEQQMHVLRQSLAEAGVTLKSFHVAGSGPGWQQGQKQERAYQPMPPYDSLHFVIPKAVGPTEPATVTTAGHIDVVA
jgi:flagellar hook-length control protein FliK